MKFGTDEGWDIRPRVDVEGSVGLQDQKTADKRKRRIDV